MNLDEAIKKHIELNGFNNAMIEQIGHVVEICKKHSIEKQRVKEAIEEWVECEYDEAWKYSDPPIHKDKCPKCCMLKELELGLE